MKKLFLILTLFILFFVIVLALPNIDYNVQIDKSKYNNVKYLQDIGFDTELPIQYTNKNVLILGIDSRNGEPSRSDVIILLMPLMLMEELN